MYTFLLMSEKRKQQHDGLSREEFDELRIRRTRLTSSAASSIQISLPSSAGTLALSTDIPSNFVTTDTTQSITGAKSFTSTLKCPSLTTSADHLLSFPNSAGTLALSSSVPSIERGTFSHPFSMAAGVLDGPISVSFGSTLSSAPIVVATAKGLVANNCSRLNVVINSTSTTGFEYTLWNGNTSGTATSIEVMWIAVL